MFKHKLGVQAESRVTGIIGTITARSENLYGCNRYYIQTRIEKDTKKMGDSWWIDEDDVIVTGNGVPAKPKDTGGPMSTMC